MRKKLKDVTILEMIETCNSCTLTSVKDCPFININNIGCYDTPISDELGLDKDVEVKTHE